MMNGAPATATALSQSIGNLQGDLSLRRLALWCRTTDTIDALRLAQLGARAGLICHLTGLDKCAANRLYRQINQRSSPTGQAPFSDGWYLKKTRRMLHAAIIWRLYQQLRHTSDGPARTLIDLYECYLTLVSEPLFDLARAAFVPRLVEMGLWHEQICQSCNESYPAPLEETGELCPGCRLHQRHRCLHCAAPAEGARKGRRQNACPDCGAPRLR